MKRRTNHYASYKDPAAKVFLLDDDEDHIYRELSPAYLSHYQHFRSSGLADELIKKNWLIPFEESTEENGTITLKARKIKFVSFPYEWTFNQWKDAAVLTLKIHYQALKHGMALKDATPFNIVFDGCKPIFIDISSFEIFKNGQPWQAFRQFSENFYLPLLLVKYFGAVGNEIFANNINGIPLSKGMALLPAKAYFNFNTFFFLALPRKIRNQYKEKTSITSSKKITQESSMQFAEQLFTNINKLKQAKQQTKWNDYYDKNIDANYLKEKDAVIKSWFNKNYTAKTLIDFGCNTGYFTKLLCSDVKHIIAFDEDMRSADELYLHCKKDKLENVSCFTANMSQPTPALGWNNLERPSLNGRLHADTGLALALVHHLAISNHIQFSMMAEFFAAACKELIIEFVPKEDTKVQLLLKDREDIFDGYSFQNFLDAFENKFTLIKEHRFSNNRILLHFMLNDEQ